MLGPRLGVEAKRLTPIEDVKEIHIGPRAHQVTKIDMSSSEEKEKELVNQHIKNVDLFS